MSLKFLLPGMALVLILAACDTQASTVLPASPTVSVALEDARPAPTPSFPSTPIPTASNTPIPPALPVLVSPVLARIHFEDENNGWGIAVNASGYVLRSVDGGKTWLDATPPGSAAIGFSTSLTVLDTNTVWVLVPATDYFSGTLYRTSDGGVTWDSSPVPFGGGFLQFLDARTGRLLADRGAGAGSEAVELFQTSDGGATWASVFHDDPSQAGSSDSLPLGGIKNGMTFLDANTGWVTGSVPEEGDVYLYVTHDGSASWLQQSLPLPSGYATYQYLPQAPLFFGNDGFLPLMISMPGRTDFTFYVTQDGGLTWSGDPTDPNKVIKPGLPAFADALDAWSWDGGTNLFLTSDGAQMWKGNNTSLDLSGRLSQLEFIPASAGRFTGWALTRLDDTGHSQLYRTTDGSTWTLLIP